METRLDARKAAQYESQTVQTIMEMRAELKTLYDGHARLTKLRQEGKCPVCLQKTGQSAAIETAISDIVAKGRDIKGLLSEAEGLDAQAKAVFEQFKSDDVAKMEAGLAALRERYDKSQRLLDAIEEIQVWLSQNAALDESKSQAVQEAIQTKKALCAAATDYISKRAELTFAGLKMNRVSISLYDVVKSTGECKDTFKFTYEGRSYRWLSLSEKLRAGLEVSELIKKLAGRQYPTFIDNGESISVIDNVRPRGQVLYAMVLHSAPLTVRSKGNAPVESAA